MAGGSIGAAKSFEVYKNFQIQPSYTLLGSLTQQNAYRDYLNNGYKSQSFQSLQSMVGSKGIYAFSDGDDNKHQVSAGPGVALNHTNKSKSFTVDMGHNFVTVTPPKQPKLTWQLDASYQITTKKELLLSVDYNLQLRSQYVGHQFVLKVSKAF